MTTSKIKGAFRKRRMPISADYRPMYKIGLIVLILKIASTGNKSSLNKLHFLIWALKSEKNRTFIKDILDRTDYTKIIAWGVEPALNKALTIGVAEGLFFLENNKYALTQKGKDFSKSILKEIELFKDEKEFLEWVGKRGVTETLITQLTLNLNN